MTRLLLIPAVSVCNVGFVMAVVHLESDLDRVGRQSIFIGHFHGFMQQKVVLEMWASQPAQPVGLLVMLNRFPFCLGAVCVCVAIVWPLLVADRRCVPTWRPSWSALGSFIIWSVGAMCSSRHQCHWAIKQFYRTEGNAQPTCWIICIRSLYLMAQLLC